MWDASAAVRVERSTSVALVALGAAVASSAATCLFLLPRIARAGKRTNASIIQHTVLDHDSQQASSSSEGSSRRPDPFQRGPRRGYLSWDDYFMAVAFLSSQRSKDPHKQVDTWESVWSMCFYGALGA